MEIKSWYQEQQDLEKIFKEATPKFDGRPFGQFICFGTSGNNKDDFLNRYPMTSDKCFKTIPLPNFWQDEKK